jgi:hypothetical protein
MTARRGDALSHVLISALTRVFRQPSATGRVAYPGDRLGQRPPLQRIRSICKLHGAMPGRMRNGIATFVPLSDYLRKSYCHFVLQYW